MARIEPLVQASSVKTVFTSPAWFAGKTAVHDADDGVADSTFNLTLEMQTNVLLEQSETIYDTSILRPNNLLNSQNPGPPTILQNSDLF